MVRDDAGISLAYARTLATQRGMSPAAIPDWFELDDADFVDLLNELKEADGQTQAERPKDWRE